MAAGFQHVTSESVAIGPETEGAFRVYADIEIERLGAESIGFLSFLEQAWQLTPTQREIVIERALATEETPISLDKIKVIVLMVLVEPAGRHRRTVARGVAARRRR